MGRWEVQKEMRQAHDHDGALYPRARRATVVESVSHKRELIAIAPGRYGCKKNPTRCTISPSPPWRSWYSLCKCDARAEMRGVYLPGP